MASARMMAPPPLPQAQAAPKSLAAPVTLVRQKLDPELASMLEGADKTVKVEVQILLRDASPATMEQLRKLGFEVMRPAGRDLQVAGRIAVESLAGLSGMEAVRYVVLWSSGRSAGK